MNAVIDRLVDSVYTPAEGVKDSAALETVEWLIACNCIPGPTLARMVADGYWTSLHEVWKTFVYLMQVRKEIMAKTGQESVHPSLIPSVEEVAAFCR